MILEKRKAIKWFEEAFREEISLGDKSEIKIIFLTEEGPKSFTPAQLLEEMRKGTPIGKKNIEIITKYLKWKREHGVIEK